MATASGSNTSDDELNTGTNENSSKHTDRLITGMDQLKIRETPENDSNATIDSKSDDTSHQDYEFVDDLESLNKTIAIIKEAVHTKPIIALNCEGDDLSRKGKVLLLSVATHTKAFLIDIKALKAIPFDLGLRDMLEDASVKKLMYDCREYADALFHQFQVKLKGVVDVQLLDVMKEHFNKVSHPLGRRSERRDEVYKLKGLLDCITTHLKNDKEMIEQKKKGAGSLSDWDKRPLKKHELEYAKTDVLSLFMLFEKLKPDEEEMERLDIASEIYVDLKRSKVNRSYDQFENNAYLPIDVIPCKWKITFEVGYTLCTTCTRHFPRNEFSNTQLREGTQKCRTCKRVKHEDDLRKNYRPPTSFRRLFGDDYGYSYYADESDDDSDDEFDDADDYYYDWDGNVHHVL